MAQQLLLRVYYFGDEAYQSPGAAPKLHQGQIVIHEKLADDVLKAFDLMLRLRLPVHSVVPIADPQFRLDGRWDDGLSMEGNNSSAFNYRRITTPSGERKRLSLHGLGMALDINPVQNPCFADPVVHLDQFCGKEAAAGYGSFAPKNAVFNPMLPAAFHERHPVVLLLESLGWTWGGRWADPKDLHHFQKIPPGLTERVAALRA